MDVIYTAPLWNVPRGTRSTDASEIPFTKYKHNTVSYEVVTKRFRTGRLELELQMVQLSLGAVVSLFCESV
jgi:hypothetical protein